MLAWSLGLCKSLNGHWKAVKRILIYLQGTQHYGDFYSSKGYVSLLGYTDFDWARDTVDKRSIAGYVFQLDSCSISLSS